MLSVHKPLTIMQYHKLDGIATVADRKLLFQVSGCRELTAACRNGLGGDAAGLEPERLPVAREI